jgi:hypothetical protein
MYRASTPIALIVTALRRNPDHDDGLYDRRRALFGVDAGKPVSPEQALSNGA